MVLCLLVSACPEPLAVNLEVETYPSDRTRPLPDNEAPDVAPDRQPLPIRDQTIVGTSDARAVDAPHPTPDCDCGLDAEPELEVAEDPEPEPEMAMDLREEKDGTPIETEEIAVDADPELEDPDPEPEIATEPDLDPELDPELVEACGSVISAPHAPGSGWDGISFSVRAHTRLTLLGISPQFSFAPSPTHDAEVWVSDDSGAWELIGTAFDIPADGDEHEIELDQTLNPGLWFFYVTTTDSDGFGVGYTAGVEPGRDFLSDGRLTLQDGIAVSYPFSGAPTGDAPRRFAGSFRYQEGECDD